MADAEAEIAAIEKEISEVEAQIALGNIENAIFENHANLQKKLENAMSVWELANNGAGRFIEIMKLNKKYIKDIWNRRSR